GRTRGGPQLRGGNSWGPDIFDTGPQLTPPQMAKRKGPFALTVRIHKLLLYVFVGTMSQETFQHSRHFRGGTARDLRTNTHGFFLHMPVDHNATSMIANMPFGQ